MSLVKTTQITKSAQAKGERIEIQFLVSENNENTKTIDT